MLKDAKGFSSFAVKDMTAAKEFYGETLGVEVIDQAEMGLIELKLGGDVRVMVYPKPDHEPAVFTVLNFVVPDVKQAVLALKEKGVPFESYDSKDIKTDENDIASGGEGPDIAWFRDPSGNICSILSE